MEFENFYYSPDKAGLEMWSCEEDLSYEFDILAFWYKDGKFYSASDSGCSCPMPFGDYKSLDELESVGSIEQAERIFDAWNKSYDGQTKIDSATKRELSQWLKDRGLK